MAHLSKYLSIWECQKRVILYIYIYLCVYVFNINVNISALSFVGIFEYIQDISSGPHASWHSSTFLQCPIGPWAVHSDLFTMCSIWPPVVAGGVDLLRRGPGADDGLLWFSGWFHATGSCTSEWPSEGFEECWFDRLINHPEDANCSLIISLVHWINGKCLLFVAKAIPVPLRDWWQRLVYVLHHHDTNRLVLSCSLSELYLLLYFCCPAATGTSDLENLVIPSQTMHVAASILEALFNILTGVFVVTRHKLARLVIPDWCFVEGTLYWLTMLSMSLCRTDQNQPKEPQNRRMTPSDQQPSSGPPFLSLDWNAKGGIIWPHVAWCRIISPAPLIALIKGRSRSSPLFSGIVLINMSKSLAAPQERAVAASLPDREELINEDPGQTWGNHSDMAKPYQTNVNAQNHSSEYSNEYSMYRIRWIRLQTRKKVRHDSEYHCSRY